MFPLLIDEPVVGSYRTWALGLGERRVRYVAEKSPLDADFTNGTPRGRSTQVPRCQYVHGYSEVVLVIIHEGLRVDWTIRSHNEGTRTPSPRLLPARRVSRRMARSWHEINAPQETGAF